MRPTFLGFEMGRKGLSVAQKGLDITGQNLSNLNTPGYTRQRIDQVSVSAYGFTSRNAGTRINVAGQGVAITGISQTRNSFLDRRFREEFSDNYYYQQKVDILNDITNVVDELAAADGGMLSAINQVASALHGLSGDKATDCALANVLRTSMMGMAQTLQDYNTRLGKVSSQQKYDLTVSVEEVNSTIARIAGLNREIVDDIVGMNGSDNTNYGPNELLDERNLLLDELSRYGNIEVTQEDSGAISVTMGGHTIVGGKSPSGEENPPDWFESIRYSDNPDSTVSIHWNSTAETVKASTGSLKAAVEMINGRGPNMRGPHDSPEKGIPYYKDQLDTFARTFANVMNSILPTGLDEEGNPVDGERKALFGALVTGPDGKKVVSPDVEITAANISISDAWANEVSFVFPSSTSLSNSKYFSDMYTRLLSDKTTEFDNFGQTFTGSFRDFISDIHSTSVGEESFYQGRLDAVGAVADQLLNQRDAVSGVSKDEETTNMLTYQKSFQAISRLVTAMDEALDIIINKMGLVGR